MFAKMLFPVSTWLNITLLSLVYHVALDVFYLIENVRKTMSSLVCHIVGQHDRYCFYLLINLISPPVFISCKKWENYHERCFWRYFFWFPLALIYIFTFTRFSNSFRIKMASFLNDINNNVAKYFLQASRNLNIYHWW